MNRIKWGVIGCGGIADRRTIPGMLGAENAQLVAVMDTNAALAKQVGEKYNAPVVCEDVAQLLVQDIDAVYIATPVFCHREQVLAAIAAKKHVLVEKPVGMTVAEVEEIKAAAQQAGVKIGIGLMMRFHTHHQQIRQMIAEGKIGDVVSMRAQFTCWYPDMENCWRQVKKLSGGGALMDLGVHCIDLLRYVSGLEVRGLLAMCSTQTFGYEVDDTASLLMKMENGAHAYVDVNFNIPDDVSCARMEFYGTKGSIIADGTLAQAEVGTTRVSLAQASGYDAMQERGELESYCLEDASGNMYTKEIEAFSQAILDGTEPVIGIDDALAVEKITEAAYQSSETGSYITL